MTRDTYVLCEGMHDRDFLSGWFETVAGWQDPTAGGKRPAPEFANERLPRGAHLFTRGDSRVCIVPCGGREQLRKLLGKWLEEVSRLGRLGYDGIVVVADGDQTPAARRRPPSTWFARSSRGSVRRRPGCRRGRTAASRSRSSRCRQETVATCAICRIARTSNASIAPRSRARTRSGTARWPHGCAIVPSPRGSLPRP